MDVNNFLQFWRMGYDYGSKEVQKSACRKQRRDCDSCISGISDLGIASTFGPINTISFFRQASANSGFSDKNPYPG